MNKKKKEYTFFWFIENYSYFWHKSGEKLISPTFTADGLDGTVWSLNLYPRAEKNEYKTHIYVTLRRNKDDGPDIFPMNFILSIVAEDKSDLFSRKFDSNFTKKYETGWYFVDINTNLSQQKNKYLPNDILTVRCSFWFGEGVSNKVPPICARTRIGIEHISYLHTVEGFGSIEPNLKPVRIQSCSKKECVISSSVYFTDGMCCEKKLVVEITPSRNDHVLAKCKIAFINTSGKIINCAKEDNRLIDTRRDIRKLPLSLTKDAIMKKRSEYLTNDKLSLLCNCTFSTGIEFQQIEGSQEVTAKGQNIINNISCIKEANVSTEKMAACPSVVDDLKDMYSNKLLTDVELKTKTSSFPAHKIMLCARSPVFKVMMNNDMKEKNSKSIQVDDLDDDTVQNLLAFLYSDNLKDLQWETATKLYYAADKYQIEKLKLLCSSFLIENLTVSTAIEVLLLADTHSDSDLKKVVKGFILEHEEQVFCSDKWAKLMEENPQLALTTLYLKYENKKKKVKYDNSEK